MPPDASICANFANRLLFGKLLLGFIFFKFLKFYSLE
jgi:hypothetical protein